MHVCAPRSDISLGEGWTNFRSMRPPFFRLQISRPHQCFTFNYFSLLTSSPRQLPTQLHPPTPPLWSLIQTLISSSLGKLLATLQQIGIFLIYTTDCLLPCLCPGEVLLPPLKGMPPNRSKRWINRSSPACFSWGGSFLGYPGSPGDGSSLWRLTVYLNCVQMTTEWMWKRSWTYHHMPFPSPNILSFTLKQTFT